MQAPVEIQTILVYLCLTILVNLLNVERDSRLVRVASFQDFLQDVVGFFPCSVIEQWLSGNTVNLGSPDSKHRPNMPVQKLRS
jgi:hypothetical protein